MSAEGWLATLVTLAARGVPHVLVTVVRVEGSAPRELGAKMVVTLAGRVSGTVGGGRLEHEAIVEAQQALRARASRLVRYPLGERLGQCCGGLMELYMDVLSAGPRLYIFGAGHVGRALSGIMVGTPFVVHLVDERPDWNDAAHVASSVVRRVVPWEDVVDELRAAASDAFVAVMTHDHDRDQAIVERLVRVPVPYLGLIGSRRKWARFEKRLAAKGFSRDELARVRCPIGVATGGKAPQEVAISVAAQLLAEHYRVAGSSSDAHGVEEDEGREDA